MCCTSSPINKYDMRHTEVKVLLDEPLKALEDSLAIISCHPPQRAGSKAS